MRRLCLLLGVAALALVWLGPLLGAWRDSFAAHMLAHMGVVAIAAPLLALSLSPFMGRRRRQADEGQRRPRTFMPPFIRHLGAPSSRRRGEGSVSGLRALPVLASLVELVVVWFWHAPTMRALAESSTLVTVAEQASFLAAGLFLWSTCLADGRQDGTGRGGGAGAFGLLLTSVHMTLLGTLLALSPRPLYGADEVSCFGVTLTAAHDQQIGGVLMLLIGAAVYLAGGVGLLARLLAAGSAGGRFGGRAAR